VYTLTIQDGDFIWSWLGTEGDAKGQTALCRGPAKLVEDYVSITYIDIGGNDCDGETDNIQWRIDDQGLLHLHLVTEQNNPNIELKAAYEARPYQKVETWSTGLPPNGVWQVTLTAEEVMQLGVSKANSDEWSGVYTHTFKDGVFHTNWQGTEGDQKGKTSGCAGTYEVVEDFVRITLDQDCGGEVDDIQWRLDDEGLHFHLVDIQNGPQVEVKALLEAKPYQKSER
jgi:hypothetical protein